MSKRNKKIIRVVDRSSETPKWMVTFADFIMLILVFFILLFSISQVDDAKFETIAEAFRENGVFDSSPTIIPFENDPLDGEEQTDEQLDGLASDIQTYLLENELQDLVVATQTDRGVVIVLQEQVLFDSGEASVLPQAQPILQTIGGLLDGIP